jgi:hypothetical protein
VSIERIETFDPLYMRNDAQGCRGDGARLSDAR